MNAIIPDINSVLVADFGLSKTDKTTVLIDGTSLHYAGRNLNMNIDYKKLRQFFQDNCNLRNIIYYTVLVIENDANGVEKHNPVKALLDWFSYNNYNVVVTERFIDARDDERKHIGNMMPHISTDIMRYAESNDHIIVFTGSNDIAYAMETARVRHGTKFTGCGAVKQGMGDEFRSSCNLVADMDTDRFRKTFSQPVTLKQALPSFVESPRAQEPAVVVVKTRGRPRIVATTY